MVSLAKRLGLTEVTNCTEIYNIGSKVFIGLLPDCASEPIDLVIETQTSISLGLGGAGSDDTVDLRIQSGEDNYTLVEGRLLTFVEDSTLNTLTYTVASDTVINSSTFTSVSLLDAQALTFNALTDVAAKLSTIWNVTEVLSPTDIPLDVSSATVDRQDLKTSQSKDTKTRLNLSSGITCIAKKTDDAIWKAVFVAANTLRNAYLVIAKSSGQIAFGRAILSDYTSNSPIDEIERPNFTAKFQGNDYRVLTSFQYLTNFEQNIVNMVKVKVGLEPEVIDPFYDETVLWLKGDNFQDSSRFNQTIVNSGSVKVTIDESDPVYGTGSFLVRPSESFLACVSPFMIISDQEGLTIECWYKRADDTLIERGLYSYNDSPFPIATPPAERQRVYTRVSSSLMNIDGNDFTLNKGTNGEWHHYAMDIRRDGVNHHVRVYRDGIGQDFSVRSNANYTTENLVIGAFDSITQCWDGHIEAFRVTRARRYLTSFDPNTDTYLKY